jgi:prolyl 4-hydroxylase
LLTRAVFGQPYYTPADDASWAIMSTDLSSILGEDKQSLYDQFIADCNEAAWSQDKGDNVCTEDEEWRMKMNIEQPPNVYNYTTVGYQKIKAPRELFDLIDEFYQKNKDKAAIEYNQVNSFHNMWDSPPTILPIQREEFGGSSELKNKILNAAKPIMEEWTGQELMAVSLFGIRTYHRGSILTPHVDRLPLVVSAISKLVGAHVKSPIKV